MGLFFGLDKTLKKIEFPDIVIIIEKLHIFNSTLSGIQNGTNETSEHYFKSEKEQYSFRIGKLPSDDWLLFHSSSQSSLQLRRSFLLDRFWMSLLPLDRPESSFDLHPSSHPSQFTLDSSPYLIFQSVLRVKESEGSPSYPLSHLSSHLHPIIRQCLLPPLVPFPISLLPDFHLHIGSLHASTMIVNSIEGEMIWLVPSIVPSLLSLSPLLSPLRIGSRRVFFLLESYHFSILFNSLLTSCEDDLQFSIGTESAMRYINKTTLKIIEEQNFRESRKWENQFSHLMWLDGSSRISLWILDIDYLSILSDILLLLFRCIHFFIRRRRSLIHRKNLSIHRLLSLLFLLFQGRADCPVIERDEG